MPRFFLEISYKGTEYSGLQAQENAISIQSVIESALQIFYKEKIALTCSSRTDSGVHAHQNYFHFDTGLTINQKDVYNINSILPKDIAVKRFIEVPEMAHARFSAISREYCYYIYRYKDPFKIETAWHYPYTLDINLLNKAAEIIQSTQDFTSFSKRNTQVNHFFCKITKSVWEEKGNNLIYTVIGDRFLRGMVRGLVGTMLQVGRGKIGLNDFEQIIFLKDCKNSDFSAPPHGLFLMRIDYGNKWGL